MLHSQWQSLHGNPLLPVQLYVLYYHNTNLCTFTGREGLHTTVTVRGWKWFLSFMERPHWPADSLFGAARMLFCISFCEIVIFAKRRRSRVQDGGCWEAPRSPQQSNPSIPALPSTPRFLCCLTKLDFFKAESDFRGCVDVFMDGLYTAHRFLISPSDLGHSDMDRVQALIRHVEVLRQRCNAR